MCIFANNYNFIMNTERLKHVLLMLLTSICAFAYNVTEDDAIHVVEEYRALVDDPGKYYVTETDTIVNNWRCPVETLTEEDWANGDYPMWLVFVDEQPNNSMWSHPCKYYYVPKQFDSPLHIPVICYEGLFMAENITAISSIIQQNRDTLSYQYISTPIDMKDTSSLHVVIIAGNYDSEDLQNQCFFKNDIQYLYKVLTQKYNIPKTNIDILFEQGSFLQTDTLSNGQIIQKLSGDLDGDSLRDIKGSTSQISIENLFSSLSEKLTIDNHLLVIVDAHGEEGLLKFWGHNLPSRTFAEYLDSIHCGSQCIVLNSCFSGSLINDLKAPWRIIMTSANRTESWVYKDYSGFLHMWTNAINGCDMSGHALKNGFQWETWVSMNDVFRYSHEKTNNELYHYIQDDISNPQYYSNPTEFGNYWGINHLPAIDMILSENIEGQIPWESSSIWIRNEDDGLQNQETEPLLITGEDSTIYIYIKVKNNGYRKYPGYGRFLHLHWNYPSLRHNRASWTSLPLPLQNNAHELTPIPITEEIDKNDSTIIRYEWEIPNELKGWAINSNHGRLFIDVLARVTDSPSFVCFEKTNTIIPYSYNSAQDLVSNPFMAESCVIPYNIGQIDNLNVNLFSNVGDSLKIKLLSDIPSFLNISFDSSVFSGTFNNTNQEISVPYLNSNLIYPVSINCAVPLTYSQRSQTIDAPIALINSNDDIIGGFTLRLYIPGENDELHPEIWDSEEQGPVEEDEEIGTPCYTGRLLSMKNVTEPVFCEWKDAYGNILSNNEQLKIAMSANGEYTLTVKSKIDGEIASISKSIQPISYFKKLKINEGSLTVLFSRPLSSGMSIVVRSVVNENLYQKYELQEGLSETTLNISSLNSGVYLISLYRNDLLLETKQILK